MAEKIRIGIYDYEVIETDEPIILNNQICKGMIDYENLTIKIKKDMLAAKKLQTLWHEIVHGIIREWGVDLQADEESVVEWLATGITQVLGQNKIESIYFLN